MRLKDLDGDLIRIGEIFLSGKSRTLTLRVHRETHLKVSKSPSPFLKEVSPQGKELSYEDGALITLTQQISQASSSTPKTPRGRELDSRITGIPKVPVLNPCSPPANDILRPHATTRPLPVTNSTQVYSIMDLLDHSYFRPRLSSRTSPYCRHSLRLAEKEYQWSLRSHSSY